MRFGLKSHLLSTKSQSQTHPYSSTIFSPNLLAKKLSIPLVSATVGSMMCCLGVINSQLSFHYDLLQAHQYLWVRLGLRFQKMIFKNVIKRLTKS
jgi:hypothetical protein